jgi:hypothetical protein
MKLPDWLLGWIDEALGMSLEYGWPVLVALGPVAGVVGVALLLS